MGKKVVILRVWVIVLTIVTLCVYFSDWKLAEMDVLRNDGFMRNRFRGRGESCTEIGSQSTNSSFGKVDFDVFALSRRSDLIGHLLEKIDSKLFIFNNADDDKDRFMIVTQKVSQEVLNQIKENFGDWCVIYSKKGISNQEFILRASMLAMIKKAQLIWIVKDVSAADFEVMDPYSNWNFEVDWLDVQRDSRHQSYHASQAISIPFSTIALVQFEKLPKSSQTQTLAKVKPLADWVSTGDESSVLYTKASFFLLVQELIGSCSQVAFSSILASQVSDFSKFRVVSVPLNSFSGRDKHVESAAMLKEELHGVDLPNRGFIPRLEEALAYGNAVEYIDDQALEVSKVWLKIYDAFKFPILLDEEVTSDSCTKSSKHLNKLELYLPIGPSLKEFNKWFMPSFQAFWPKPLANLVLMMDEERTEKFRAPHKLVGELDSSWISYISWNSPTFKAFYNKKGYDRQQFLMFWADNFTDSEFIGFVDDDTVFVSRVLESDLFDSEGKPVMIAFIGEYEDQDWKRRSRGTVYALQMPETMRCMSNFPVIVHREDLADMRDYISRVHSSKSGRQTSFNDVFKIISAPKGYYSQFNIMCTYLWNFKHEKYSWKLQKSNVFKPGVNKNITFEILNDEKVKPEMLVPKARIATHFTYQLYGKVYDFQEALNHTKCYSTGEMQARNFPSELSYCADEVNTTQPFDLQWRFEGQNWMWDSRVQEEHVKRMSLLKQCST